MVGRTLSHYKVQEKIGSGGMGEVYVAEDTKLGRQVALKVLPPEMATDERLMRFEREAKAVAALDHPNIVTIHSVEESEDVHFYTMQLVKGKTVTELIPKKGLPLAKFFEIAIPLTDAVSAAHEQGITHRDLKPDNLMVSDDGRLKILDFGLAKLKLEVADVIPGSELPTEHRTEEGRILGTVAYMSPEQAEGKTVDHRSDIFSIGILLYEMATGERPFQGDTKASLMSSILRDTPPSVTELRSDLPRDVAKLIRRCLAKDPEDRLQAAKDLRNELKELRQEMESGEILGKVATLSTGRKWTLVTVFALVALIAAVGTYLLIRPGKLDTDARPAEVKFTRLTSQTGTEFLPSLSPDGEFFTYTRGEASGNYDIYLQRVDGEKGINLTESFTGQDREASFSPDGRQIAFFSERDGGGIFVMGSTGESVKRVTDYGRNPAWSPDGKRLVFSTVGVSHHSRGSDTGQLKTVDLETGEVQTIEVSGDGVQPRWSPNGHRIVFWSVTLSGDNQRDIWTISPDGGEPVPVTNDEHIDWNPVWSPDGESIYFCSNRAGTMSLWRIAIDEDTGSALGDPELVTASVAAEMGNISISGDGKRIAYKARVFTSNIHRIAFDPESGTVVGEPIAITESSRHIVYPSISPDGDWVAFSFMEGGGMADVALMRVDGSDLRQLTDAPNDSNWMPRWSPDGSQIAFYSRRSGSHEIWTIKPDGSRPKQLTETPYDITHFVWSPDGSQMAYFGLGEGTFLFEVGSPWQEQEPQRLPPPNGGGRFMANSWSPDGAWLASAIVREGEPDRISFYSTASGKYQILPVRGLSPAWLSDSRRVLYSWRGEIRLLDRESGKHEKVLSLIPDFATDPVLTNDDRWLYFMRSRNQADIWMLTLNEDQK